MPLPYDRMTRTSPEMRFYFLDPIVEAVVPFVEGAAAIVFCFSFFGFFASRLPRCSPLAMSPLLVPKGCELCEHVTVAEARSDAVRGSVDRADEVALADPDSVVAQDGVGRGAVKVEVREGKGQKVGLSPKRQCAC